MARFSVAQIDEAKDFALNVGLEHADIFASEDSARLTRICNGIGAEWMPEKARVLLDRRFRELSVVCMIHDYDYYIGDGTRLDFFRANERIARNGAIVAKYWHGWYSPKRYIVIWDSRKLRAVCDGLGWLAYRQAMAQRIHESCAKWI